VVGNRDRDSHARSGNGWRNLTFLDLRTVKLAQGAAKRARRAPLAYASCPHWDAARSRQCCWPGTILSGSSRVRSPKKDAAALTATLRHRGAAFRAMDLAHDGLGHVAIVSIIADIANDLILMHHYNPVGDGDQFRHVAGDQ
jgi:hypothetical protein